MADVSKDRKTRLFQVEIGMKRKIERLRALAFAMYLVSKEKESLELCAVCAARLRLKRSKVVDKPQDRPQLRLIKGGKPSDD